MNNSKFKNWKLFLMLLSIGLSGPFLTSCEDDEKPKTKPMVTTAAVTEVTTSSAKSGGNITSDGNSTITASGLVYSSVVSQPTIADDKTVLTATTGTFTSLMENLTSGTTYHVRAYATNGVGTSYGEVVDFETGNAAPMAIGVSITGDIEVNKELTATYTYNDAESDAEGGSIFQWYVANDAIGTGEAAIVGATALTYTIEAAQHGKFIRFSVTPKAATGNTIGIAVKSSLVGAVGEATTVTFMYNGQSVTYGILNSAATGRKWLDRNLGAPSAPTAYDDYANYGDLFQWGRLADGHQLIVRGGPNNENMSGANGTTSSLSSIDDPAHSLFIIKAEDPADWRSPQNNDLWQGVNGINNPCPSEWRIATDAEWVAENLGTLAEAYTKLNITLTSIRSADAGAFFQSTTTARYWTSTIDDIYSVRTSINSEGTSQSSIFRGNGYPCRCIKD